MLRQKLVRAALLIGFVLICAALPLARQQAADGTGVIIGRVVDAGTGEPVPGAMVILVPGVLETPIESGDIPAVRQYVLTNSDGRFVFGGLLAGDWQITVTASGYLAGRYGQSRPDGPGAPLTAREGQINDEVEIALFQPGVITGAVLDEAGEPLVGASVRAVRVERTLSVARFLSETSTVSDDRGQYRLSGLPPGSYLVAVPVSLR